MSETWVDAPGARLFVRHEGSGHTIVMLHGGMASHHAALPLVAPLADRFHIVTPDVRGNGRSPFGGTLTFDMLADDVSAVLDDLRVDRAIVGGVSGGSGVALRMARRHPDRVAGLVLVQPVYAGQQRGYSAFQHATFRMMDTVASRALDEGVQVLEPLYAQLPERVRDRALALLATYDAASIVATSRFIAAGTQPFAADEDLAAIRVPVLVVRGNDALHPAAVSDLYAAHFPHCTVCPASTADVAGAIADFARGCA